MTSDICPISSLVGSCKPFSCQTGRAEKPPVFLIEKTVSVVPQALAVWLGYLPALVYMPIRIRTRRVMIEEMLACLAGVKRTKETPDNTFLPGPPIHRLNHTRTRFVDKAGRGCRPRMNGAHAGEGSSDPVGNFLYLPSLSKRMLI
ncbi:unnamed protein product [Protopolystoma xenopodis]|uniref:Uncharacterized protein n=1 Tax=Protopolystoma xenopodis TaxID=117903 RepID=A0A3S5CUZ6_9PLAT|nr:unnamed protein product [Protopolystoma xenopodis]